MIRISFGDNSSVNTYKAKNSTRRTNEYLQEKARQTWNWDHPMNRVNKSHASKEIQALVEKDLRWKRICERFFKK